MSIKWISFIIAAIVRARVIMYFLLTLCDLRGGSARGKAILYAFVSNCFPEATSIFCLLRKLALNAFPGNESKRIQSLAPVSKIKLWELPFSPDILKDKNKFCPSDLSINSPFIFSRSFSLFLKSILEFSEHKAIFGKVSSSGSSSGELQCKSEGGMVDLIIVGPGSPRVGTSTTFTLLISSFICVIASESLFKLDLILCSDALVISLFNTLCGMCVSSEVTNLALPEADVSFFRLFFVDDRLWTLWLLPTNSGMLSEEFCRDHRAEALWVLSEELCGDFSSCRPFPVLFPFLFFLSFFTSLLLYLKPCLRSKVFLFKEFWVSLNIRQKNLLSGAPKIQLLFKGFLMYFLNVVI